MLRFSLLFTLALTTLLALTGCVHSTGNLAYSPTDVLYRAPAVNQQTRWATWENPQGEKGAAGQANAGRKGSPRLPLPAGESAVLAQVENHSGTIRRIWMTISNRSPQLLRGIVLDFYWDNVTTPSFSVPVGDFFGHMLGRMATFDSALVSSPEGRSFNCCMPMPFKTGMKVVVRNETETSLGMLFYEIDYTLGDRHPADMLYFHAYFNRQNPTTMRQDYPILPRVTGTGRYLGAFIGVKPDQEKYLKSWWGEGEVKVYLDGDTELPTLCGTGTEDYIGTGWGQGRYDNLYQGSHIAGGPQFEYGFYRLHVPDPVFFHEEARVTIQQIGCGGNMRQQLRETGTPIYAAGADTEPLDLSGKGHMPLFEREDDWSSVAYFYLDRPQSGLPPLLPLAERVEGLE